MERHEYLSCLEAIEGISCTASGRLCTDADVLETVARIEEQCAKLRALVAQARRDHAQTLKWTSDVVKL